MGGNTTPYIEYCLTWKSIAVVELKFYSLEKHSQLHGNLVWSNPIAQGIITISLENFCSYIYT